MNQVINDIAAARSNVTVVDFASAFDVDSHLISDQVHLNNEGQQLLGTMFAAQMGITSVPEPSAFYFFSIAGAALLGWRKLAAKAC